MPMQAALIAIVNAIGESEFFTLGDSRELLANSVAYVELE